MTKEELKKHCQKQIEKCEMWAKAKGEEPSGKVHEEHKLILELLEQEPCEDAISRDAAIDLIADFELSMDEVVRGIHALPPVTPLPIHNAIIIPNNATNGDVIKAMFPYAVKSNYIESSLDMKDYVSIDLGDYEMRVSYDWWNAPYKPESEEKE